jgi:anhydro-N-acetylmuramic acid kinase
MNKTPARKNFPPLKSIGLMSGTSMDGIDAVLMETDGQHIIDVKASMSLAYDTNFQLKLREVELLVRKEKKDIAPPNIIKQSTELHAEIVLSLLKKAGLKAQDVDLIGYHGQALYHNPAEGMTIQIGDGQLLANLTKIPVINDFRSEDIANGGQGAPLAPLYHQALATKANLFPLAIINCGGIANISIISGPKEDQVIGFDTGPGNVLIDRYIRKKTNSQEFIDLDGKYGLKGSVNPLILSKLLDSIAPYLAKPAPKSLDPGNLYLIDELDNLSINDACATLEYFTAKTIADSIPTPPNKWALAGGGWNNPVIKQHLSQCLLERLNTVDIKTASEMGWDSVYMEAEIFAYLAVRSFYKLPISLTKVTGARKPSLGGKLYLPN